MIDFELHVDSLQEYCKDEITPYLDRVTQGIWGWAEEYVVIIYATDPGTEHHKKRIHGVWFDKEEDADFFLLKYPNLIK